MRCSTSLFTVLIISETITITLARKHKLTTESNVSEAIQQPSSVKYEQKSDAGRDIKHNVEETTECRQWNVRDGMHKQKCGMTMNSCNDVK